MTVEEHNMPTNPNEEAAAGGHDADEQPAQDLYFAVDGDGEIQLLNPPADRAEGRHSDYSAELGNSESETADYELDADDFEVDLGQNPNQFIPTIHTQVNTVGVNLADSQASRITVGAENSLARRMLPPINISLAEQSYLHEGEVVRSPVPLTPAPSSQEGGSIILEQPLRSPRSESSRGSLFTRLTSIFTSASVKEQLAASGRTIKPLEDVNQNFTARIIDKDDKSLYVEYTRSDEQPLSSPKPDGSQSRPSVVEINKEQHPQFFGAKNTNEPLDVLSVKVLEEGGFEVENLTQLEREFESAQKERFHIAEPDGKFMAQVSEVVGNSIYVRRLLDSEGSQPARSPLYKIEMSDVAERPEQNAYVQFNSITERDKRIVVVTPVAKEQALEQAALEYEATKLRGAIQEPSKSFSGTVTNVFADKVYIRAAPERGVGGVISAAPNVGLLKLDISSFPHGTKLSPGDNVKGNVMADAERVARAFAIKHSDHQEAAETQASTLTLAQWLVAAEIQAIANREQGVDTTVNIGSAPAQAPLSVMRNGEFKEMPEPTRNCLPAFERLPPDKKVAIRAYVATECPDARKFSIAGFDPNRTLADFKFPTDRMVPNVGDDEFAVVATPRNPGGNQGMIAKVFIVPIEYIEKIVASRAVENGNSQSREQPAERRNLGHGDSNGNDGVGGSRSSGGNRRSR